MREIGRQRAVRWIAVLSWAAVIFAMSSIPGSGLPAGRYATLAHFLEYALLAALLYTALRLDLSAGRALAIAVIVASAYGFTDEVHQAFVPMRTPDPVDWVVDTLGATAGAGAAWFLERSVSARQKNRETP